MHGVDHGGAEGAAASKKGVGVKAKQERSESSLQAGRSPGAPLAGASDSPRQAECGSTGWRLLALGAELRELQQEGAAGLKAEQERSVSSVHKPAGSPEAALAGAADSPMLLYAEESVHSEESGIWISAVEGVAFLAWIVRRSALPFWTSS